MGNLTSIAMGLAAQEEEEEAASVGSDGEGGTGEKEQQEEEEGRGAAAEEEVEGEDQDETVLQCSICLDAVVAGGKERSTARLQCGHEFHLDCIGSAFNSIGVMQCPNCRNVEMGYWRYASGPSSSQDVSNDDGVLDENLDFAPEVFVPLRFRWCPISRLSELPSLFEETEPSSAAAFDDVVRQNFDSETIDLPEPSTPQAPYLAYLQPLLPPVSSSNSHIVNRTVDGSAYHDHWNSLARPSDGQPLQSVHRIDFNHNNPWAPIPHSYSPPNNNNVVAEQPGLPVGVGAVRIGGVDSGGQQQGSLPPFYGNGSERPRVPSVPPLAPQLIRAPGNINQQFEQGFSSLYAGSMEYGARRPFGAGVIPSDRPFYLTPEASPGSSSMQTTENVGGNRFYSWERGPHLPLNNEGVWVSFSQQQLPRATPEPTSAPSMLFGNWVGSTRPPPENNRSL